MILSRKKGWIGIEWGTRSLKVAQAERVGATVRLAASVVIPRNQALADQPDADAEAPPWQGRDILSALALNGRFSGNRVACVLPMRLTDLHAMEIPPGTAGEQRAMVAHELASRFSDHQEERDFDFWETAAAATATTSAKGNVNVLSVPRGVVSRMVGAVSKAKLRCEVLDGLPFVLARAIKLAYPANPRTLIGAVNWGSTSATFCVASDGSPLFTRHLRNCGIDSLAGAASRALGLSVNEAMQLLAEHGLPCPDSPHGRSREIQDVIAEVAAHHLNEMAEELKKTLSYLQMQYSALLPERLCLVGDGATVKHVTDFLAERIKLPIDVWRLPDGEATDRNASRDPPAILATAVALSSLAWNR